ncbi:MAG: hypothetical protein H7831_05970 [Magnetococcus sp. WYHC-3]
MLLDKLRIGPRIAMGYLVPILFMAVLALWAGGQVGGHSRGGAVRPG